MHKVTKDAFTLILFSAVAGIASYLYTFAMARMLSVEEYGLLYSIISLMYILGVPQETIRTVISRYVTKYNAKKEKGKINELMSSSLKKIALFSFVIIVIFLAISPLLTGLLHTSFWVLAISGSLLIFSFLLPALWGFYQGLGKFKELGINNSIEGVLKLLAAILLVAILPIGIKVHGALLASPISMGIAFLIAYWSFKSIRKNKKKKLRDNLTKYSFATFIIFGLVTLMYTVDVILARFFFHPKISGIYAAISLICKSLFIIATGTKRAMLPNLTEKNLKSQEKECKKILKKVSWLIGFLFIGAFLLSVIFPEQVINLVVGGKYSAAAPYLKYMVIAMAFFSFANMLVYYNLALDKNKRMTTKVLASAVFIEIVLLVFFHRNIQQFVLMMLIVNALLFFGMLIVTIIHPRHAKKSAEKEAMEIKRINQKS